MDIREQVGLNVQRFRRALGLSQEELAFTADIHRTYISGVERGVRNTTVTVVARLADALQVAPHELLEPLPGKRAGAARPAAPAAPKKGGPQKVTAGRTPAGATRPKRRPASRGRR